MMLTDAKTDRRGRRKESIWNTGLSERTPYVVPYNLAAWLPLAILVVAGTLPAGAQAPDVPIYRQGRQENRLEDSVQEAAKQLFSDTNAVKLPQVKEQLKSTTCELELPKVSATRLSQREVYVRARRSHLRIGWSYLCNKCDQWHVNLAGGYVLNSNGAVATCYHVVNPPHELKEGCLVAADEDGKVWPVTEVLAANRYSDAAIVRVAGEGRVPLPLNTNVYPGDVAYCYSDPLDHRGYFSSGIVNRFYTFPGRRPVSAPKNSWFAPTRLNVSTDWAPGSSGSAVLDDCGNAIGHVSTIATLSDADDTDTESPHPVGPTMIIFHEAVAARDVLQLTKPKP
jgi:hypothetical protein